MSVVDAARGYAAIGTVKAAQDAETAIKGLTDGTEALGFDSSIFASFIKGDVTFEDYRFLANCSGPFCRAYQDNRLHLNDPFLAYSLSNTGEIWGSKVRLTSPAAREAADAIRRGGFESMLVVPAHSPNGVLRRGTLMLGCKDKHPAEDDEALAVQVFTIGQALAQSLHKWCGDDVRNEALKRFGLNQQELTILQGVHEELTSKELARLLEVSPKAIDSKIGRILEKMDKSTRGRAADDAFQKGLIGNMSLQEMVALNSRSE